MGKVSPPKVTSGAGFTFENKVGAYYVTQLLLAIPPLGESLGLVRRMDFQVRAQGWLVDDLLLTLERDGIQHQCAISAKSNTQFTGYSAPKDMVQLLWRQYLHEGTSQFDRVNDSIGLVICPPANDLKAEIDELINWSRAQTPVEVLNMVRTAGSGNDAKRELLRSFACPSELESKYGVREDETIALLSRLWVLPFDFEANPSEMEKLCLRNCRDILLSNSMDEAALLWEDIFKAVDEQRVQGGFLDLPKLTSRLRKTFRLRDFPEFQTDWRKLSELSKQRITTVPDKIGSGVHLSRAAHVVDLNSRLSKGRAVVTLGPSGSGKSVLAKCVALQWAEKSKVFWWNAETFQGGGQTTFEESLGLNHPLDELLANVPDERPLIVIDGIDRILTRTGFNNLSSLLQKLNLKDDDTPWSLLATCCAEDWERVQSELSRSDVAIHHWEVCYTREPALSELVPVWTAYPALQGISLKPHIHPLILNLKILDLLASHVEALTPSIISRWVGESDLIEWYWKSEVSDTSKGPLKSRFLMQLGERQAEVMRSEIPITEFDVGDLDPLEDLKHAAICKENEGRIDFAHDILGDWARQRVLLSHLSDLSGFMQHRLESPLWHRAFRLLGVHLLEQREDVDSWNQIFESVQIVPGAPILFQDLLLDSILFSANALTLLDRLLPLLVKDRGILLHRLLKRFLFVATLPNPLMVKLGGVIDPDAKLQAATMERIPYLPYWLPMVAFLHRHLEKIENLVPFEAAAISSMWLRSGKENDPLHRESAEIALRIAELELGRKLSDGITFDKGVLKEVYRGAVAAYGEYPERVRTIVLVASSRIEPNGTILEERERVNSELRKMREEAARIPRQGWRPKPIPPMGSMFALGELPQPWPIGPKKRVESSFKKACLETDVLYPLIREAPDLAKEVILALLIDEPKRRNNYSSPVHDQFELEVDVDNAWYPPLFSKGPFLFFLVIHPDEGLALILAFVNFVTSRWAELQKRRGRPVPSIDFESGGRVKNWLGDANVYYWYRDESSCPLSVVSSLMALEKWFYHLIDTEAPVEAHVKTILQGSQSLAFIGVLSAVGRKQPSLFIDSLKDLLVVPELSFWEFAYSLQPAQFQMFGWSGRGEQSWKIAQEWHNLENRKTPIGEWAIWIYLNNKEMESFFETARVKWAIDVAQSKEESQFVNWLKVQIARFDRKNYTIQKDEGDQSLFEYHEPEDLREENETRRKQSSEQLEILRAPLRFTRMLEEGKLLSDVQAAEIWSQIEKYSATLSKSAGEQHDNLINLIAGSIAVLFRLARPWCRRDPARLQLCRMLLIQIVTEPKGSGSIDTEVSIAPFEWDRFCANAVPALWAEEPTSQEVRTIVARLALNPHYETIEILFRSAAKERAVLGFNFKQVQNFFLDWISFSFVQMMRGRTRDPGILKDIQLKIEEWMAANVSAFVSGKTSSTDRQLTDFFYPAGIPPAGTGRKHIYFDIDSAAFRAAFSWMPPIEEALTPSERVSWINFWRDVIKCTIVAIDSHRQKEGDFDGIPNDWDGWVFEHTARLLIRLLPEEQAEDLWQDIIRLGPAAHHWVEDFFTVWIEVGLTDVRFRTNFLNLWRLMIGFASSHEDWQAKSGWHSLYLSEVWIAIMGFQSSRVKTYWTRKNADIADSLKPEIETWAKEHLFEPRIALHFAHFLEQEGAVGLRLEGLAWLYTASKKRPTEFWDERYMAETMMSLLELCWRKHHDALVKNAETMSSFNSLLRALADLQNVLALQLMEEVIGNLSGGPPS